MSLPVDKALRKAQKHIKARDLAEAEELYKQVLSKFPKNKKAIQGYQKLKAGITSKGSSNSGPPQAALDQIISLYNQGQLDQTVALAEGLAKQYPNALVLYNILGAAYMGLKDANKTIASYQKALKLNPNHTDAYNNMGMAFYDQGRFDEAVDSYQKAVKLEPDFADAHYNLGNALNETGDLKQAIESYKASLAINPNDAEVLFNFGNTLKNYGDLGQAIEVYVKALKISPNYTAAQTNMDNAIEEKTEIDTHVATYASIAELEIGSAEMVSFTGGILNARGYPDAAIDRYKQAIKIKPDYAEAHNDMGAALEYKGKLEASIDSYQQALRIKPDSADYFVNCEFIATQVSDGSALESKFISFSSKSLKRALCENPKHQILQSINYFLKGDCEASRNNLRNYKILVEAVQTEKLTKLDKAFCSAYAGFINHLINKLPIQPNLEEKKIYHFGESHCLSYAHHKFKIGKQTLRVSPKITFGAKAYHLSKLKDNIFKSITKLNLNSIPNNSSVIISFGEIDCRLDEGFIPASKKTGKSPVELVQKTVRGYLKFFLDANVNKNHRYRFLNVPSPVYQKAITLNANQDIAKVVFLFNETLKKNLAKYSLNLIDVYGPSRTDSGFSNGLYHCDRVHLDCRILNTIQDQITK